MISHLSQCFFLNIFTYDKLIKSYYFILVPKKFILPQRITLNNETQVEIKLHNQCLLCFIILFFLRYSFMHLL